VGVLGSACGGGGGGSRLSKADYQTKVQAIGDEFSSTLDDVFSDPALQDPSSLTEAADVIRHGADLIRQAADDLDALNPPAEVEATHDQFVAGFKAFADDLDGFAQATEDGDLDAIEQFNQQLNDESLDSMKQVQDAVDAFEAAGYDLDTTT
jgi:soluble cytochrome b562